MNHTPPPWYEIKQLPHIGSKVIYGRPNKREGYSGSYASSNGVEVIIIGHVVAPNGQPVAAYSEENCNNNPVCGIAAWFAFKPIKSEREIAIEEIAGFLQSPKSRNTSLAEDLYDFGLRRIKDSKND